MQKKSKIIIISIVAALVLVVGVFTAISLVGSSEAPVVQAGTSEQLSLGQKFLIDLEYEKAVAEFNAVIEIEPKNVDAYIGLADAYIGMGDENKAIETLEKGLAETGDERIQARLDEMKKAEETTVETTTVPETTTVETTTTSEETTIPEITTTVETIPAFVHDYVEGQQNTQGTKLHLSTRNGYFTSQGDWIYYVNGKGELYKMKKDGSNKTKVRNRTSNGYNYINAIGDYIFFQSGIAGSIYRMKTDGSEYTCINDGNRRNDVKVKDGWIYFIISGIGEDPSYLYRMDFNGENITKISPEECHEYIIKDDYIYYRCYVGGRMEDLYRMKLDGTENIKLNKEYSVFQGLNYYNGYIYFANGSTASGKLYRISANGGDTEKVTDFSVQSPYVEDGYIYYYEKGLNRSDMNGNTQKLSDAGGFVKYTDEEWIYHSGSAGKFRTKKDGSVTEEL